MAKWVAPLVVGGLIGFAARESDGRRAKANFKPGDRVVSIHPSAPPNYTGRVKGPSGMSPSLVRVAWDGDDAPDRTVNVKYLRHSAKGRQAKKDRVSSCISGKVRGEGWNQRQAVAACLSMQEQGRLRADGSYIRKGRRAKHSKRDFVKQVWERQAPTIRGEPLPPPIPGMEGPFRFRSGKIFYYDPKEGAYYDRGSDLYVTVDEVEAAMSGRLWWDR